MNSIKRIILSAVFTFFISAQSIFAQNLDPKIGSMFIYSFTKYIEWPQGVSNGDFVIGVLGTSPIYSELLKLSATKKVGSRNISIKLIQKSSPQDLSNVHLLLVSEDQSSNLKSILENLKSLPILVVGEKEGLAKKGAGISIFLDEEDEFKTKFQLNKPVLENAGLKIATNLIALAILVK